MLEQRGVGGVWTEMRWSWREPIGPLVLQYKEFGILFNENEKLLKGFNWGSDLFLKLTGCCVKQEEARGYCSSQLELGILTSTVAVEMELGDKFWRWSEVFA